MSPDQNEIIVDFNFKEIKNNELVEEVKPKPKAKRATKKNNIVVEDIEDIKPTEDIKPEEPEPQSRSQSN